MYNGAMFLTNDQKAEFREAFLRLGRHWQNLRHASDLALENLWQVKPKVHWAQHFPMQAELINPRAVQNYCEESLIGRAAKIWSASATGTYMTQAQKTTLARYWAGFELRIGG